jgi:hypothetical protein
VTRLPLFRFGAGEPPDTGWISGPLLFDSGEADKSFLYRCQDRYFAYNLISGIRSVVMVTCLDHVERYRSLWRAFCNDIGRAAEATGLAFPVLSDPLYVPLDWESLSIARESWFFDQHLPKSRGIVTNQVSPTGARILKEFNQLMPSGLFERNEFERLEKSGALALRFHDKTVYVESCAGNTLNQDSASALPRHAATLVLSDGEMRELVDWRDVTARFPGEPTAAKYVLKSSFDSGGNFAVALDESSCGPALGAMHDLARAAAHGAGGPEAEAALVRDLELSQSLVLPPLVRVDPGGLLREQFGKRGGVRFLLQEWIRATGNEAGPAGAGICCDAESGPLFASGQIYRDRARQHFLGSYLNREFSDSVLGDEGRVRAITALCHVFAGVGYRGPLGFDACRGPGTGEWTFIFDCNPRLTAVYPALAVQRFLEGQARHCEHVISLGYRGESGGCDYPGRQRELSAKGLLYGSGGRDHGVLLLPNLSRAHSCDALLVNIPLEEAARFLERSELSGAAGEFAW